MSGTSPGDIGPADVAPDDAGLAREELTMLGTLAGRARDARGERILGDDAALAVFDSLDARTRERAEHGLGATDDASRSVALRALVVDDLVRGWLAGEPEAVVVDLGSGLDTRADRIAPGPGVTWVDVDRPPVIALRRRLLPAAGGPPRRHVVSGSVVDEATIAQLPTGRPTLVVAEGLSMYLTPEEGGALVARLVDHLGDHVGGGGAQRNGLVLDVFSRLGIRLQWTNTVVRRAGARLHWAIDDPRVLEPIGVRLEEDVQLDAMMRRAGPRLSEAMRRRYEPMTRWGPMRRMSRVLRYSF